MKHLLRRLGANAVTARGYAVFRTALGAYLLVHFAQLVPWGAELFSSAGIVPDAHASPLLPLFPNLLALVDTPLFVTALLVGASALAAALTFGVGDRAAAVALWYILACLSGRNPLIANPALPCVGWLLLAHALAGPSRRARAAGGWRMPAPIFACAWLVMAAGYSYAGLTKLASPSWVDGSALAAVLANPLARPTALRTALLVLPDPLLQLATWSALALELAALPLALAPGLRPWLWAALVGLHLSLLVLLDFADLTAGMLLFHCFTFDPSWLARLWHRHRAAQAHARRIHA
jgi:hypothetical protein